MQGFSSFPWACLLFLSSAFLRGDPSEEWFARPTYNPVSYMVEGIRSLVISGWDGPALAQAFAIALIAIVGCLALSARALRTRLVRT